MKDFYGEDRESWFFVRDREGLFREVGGKLRENNSFEVKGWLIISVMGKWI